MALSFKVQKYIYIIIILAVNLLLSLALNYYDEYWYLYILILTPNSLLTILRIIFITIVSIYEYFNKKNYKTIKNKSIVYLTPCYNESKQELYDNINSIINQKDINDYNNQLMVIICDGKVTGKGNDKSTDRILVENIFHGCIFHTSLSINAYKTWDNEFNDVNIYAGVYKHMKFILLIKQENVGKRDSISLLRNNLYKYNTYNTNNEYTVLDKQLFKLYSNFGVNKLDCIIGTDGDTVLDNKCVHHLITELYNEDDKNIVGLAGFIKISDKMNFWSPIVFHQHISYIKGQITTRLHQSKITKKVNCLPGCVQIINIQEETCGNKIMDEYNRLPTKDESLVRNLRAHVGEDRMHICTAMVMFPHIKTKQSINAIAYTTVPNSWKVYLSQQRRWGLGSNSNQTKLVMSSKINVYERISAFFNILSWLLTFFITFAVIHLIIALTKLDYFNFESDLIWATVISITIIVSVVNIYLIICPTWLSLSKKETIFLYIGILTWYVISLPLKIIVHIYTLYNLDNFSWGETRQIEEEPIREEYNYSENISPITIHCV